MKIELQKTEVGRDISKDLNNYKQKHPMEYNRLMKLLTANDVLSILCDNEFERTLPDMNLTVTRILNEIDINTCNSIITNQVNELSTPRIIRNHGFSMIDCRDGINNNIIFEHCFIGNLFIDDLNLFRAMFRTCEVYMLH